jgi:hypothetical protein
MTEPKTGIFSPEFLKKLREINKRADAIAAPSVAYAAQHWAEDTQEDLDDMVARGLAIPITRS